MVERMLWCKPQYDSCLHLQPLSFLWSLPMRVWKPGDGNESSWAIMNVLIQVCFDEIPPDWSQITEQNSKSLLTMLWKLYWLAIWWKALSYFKDPFRILYSASSLPSYLLCGSLCRMKSDQSVSTFALMFKSKSSLLDGCHASTIQFFASIRIPPEENRRDIIYCCNPELGPGVTNMQ